MHTHPSPPSLCSTTPQSPPERTRSKRRLTSMSQISKPIDLGSQIRNPKRFTDGIVHACCNSHTSLFRPRVCRNTEYRHMTPQLATLLHFAYLFRCGEAIHNRHFCIHKNDMEFFLWRICCCGRVGGLVPISSVPEKIDGFLAVVCCPDHVAFVCELAFEYFLVYCVVLRYQDVDL
jgi:hypothetical protein